MNLVHSQHLLIGLPSAGKTSFLAALWYMVSQTTSECGLTLRGLEGDSAYLNLIRDAWAKYKPVPRNKAGILKRVSMLLGERKSDKTVGLRFPDLSGEAFEAQWADRQLGEEYAQSLTGAAGGLLFVSPEGIRKPHRIDTIDDVLAAIGAGGIPGASDLPTKAWNIEEAPTQVQLVEVLQLMAQQLSNAPFRLAVVVSAWDRVNGGEQTPTEWLAVELPLLKQFLDSNDETFEVSYWGVSAQGGRYALPHFYPEHFLHCEPFVVRVCKCEDPISQWVWSQVNEGVRASLQSIRDGKVPGDSEKKLLAIELNRLMGAPGLYDEARFRGVHMRSETEELVRNADRQQEEDIIYMGRLLLEDAYPSELSRERRNAKEAAALQRKRPADRIIVVKDRATVGHDITEPIQWLIC